MKIKYLKQMHNADIGDVLDIPDDQAKVLILLGVAVELTEAPKKKGKNG